MQSPAILAAPFASQVSAGVMDESYARLRCIRPALRFRLRSRALVAAEAWKKYAASGSPRILDLGAAEGRTLVEIARHLGSGRYVGVELDEGLSAAAGILPPGMALVKGDVCALPDCLEDGFFDVVSLLAVLEHVLSPVTALQEAKRMLRAGGLVVATCPNPLWDRVAGRLGLVRDEHHVQQLDLSALCGLAEQAGLEIVEARRFMWSPIACLPYLRVPVPVKVADAIDRLVNRIPLLNQLCVNAYVVARKPMS